MVFGLERLDGLCGIGIKAWVEVVASVRWLSPPPQLMLTPCTPGPYSTPRPKLAHAFVHTDFHMLLHDLLRTACTAKGVRACMRSRMPHAWK